MSERLTRDEAEFEQFVNGWSAELWTEDLIQKERARQDQLVKDGVIAWNCSDTSVADSEKLAVLMEEVGEVAREVLDGPPFRKEMTEELVQCGAVIFAWLESLYPGESDAT